jgi:DNA binding domain, excisionase family
MEDKYYSAAEVAELLKLKKVTVYEMIRRGEIPSVKLGKQFRIAESDLEGLLSRTGSAEPFVSSKTYRAVESAKITSSSELSPTASPSALSWHSHRESSNRENSREGSFILCGQDPSLDIITTELAANPDMPPILHSYAGSYNGLYQLYRGAADACTSHLWDEKTKTYNLPFLEHLLPGMNVIVARLFGRMTGFYVAAGNPKKIKSWDDLKRHDISFCNREPGSGTRVLLDAKLKLMGLKTAAFNGYGNIKTSFLSVASSVISGEADFGLGMQAAERLNPGIEFIPLQKEWLDIIFPSEPRNTLPYEILLDYISSERFIMSVRNLGDYDFAETGRVFRV